MSTPPPEETPSLSVQAFADSLYHGERANNYFKFLHNFASAGAGRGAARAAARDQGRH